MRDERAAGSITTHDRISFHKLTKLFLLLTLTPNHPVYTLLLLRPYIAYPSSPHLPPLAWQQLPNIFIIGPRKGSVFRTHPIPVSRFHSFQEITHLVNRSFPTAFSGVLLELLPQSFRHAPWCRVHSHQHSLFCFDPVIDHGKEDIDFPAFGFRKLLKIYPWIWQFTSQGFYRWPCRQR